MTRPNTALSLRNELLSCNPATLPHYLKPADLKPLLNDWEVWARDDQLAPSGEWRRWLVLGGRGAGKTRTGAEHIREMTKTCASIALVGETFNDVREVMIEGLSGLRKITHDRPQWEATRRRLLYPNGAIAYAFSAEDPESLRGPQFSYAWIDEYAKFKQAEEVMDMLSFGLRLGDNPRMVITTTPRPTPALKKLMLDETTVITRSKTGDNAANLSHHFMRAVNERYAGTRLGRQELDGELMEDRADALWSRTLIDECRITLLPSFKRVVVAVDPPASSKISSDKCGLVVVGLTDDNKMVVIEDATSAGLKPLEWAAKAVRLYHKHQADRIIAEVNQGGEMVTTILREIDPMIAVDAVHATRGKYLRAEPVAALYQQGRVLHAGIFTALEDEMCDFTADGLSSGRSPDRLDALVWAVTGLMRGRGEPRVRRV